MGDFSDKIEHMSLIKSLINAIFEEHTKKSFVTQLKLYLVFLISIACSICLWESHILGSLISASIGLLMLLILHLVYELPQRRELGYDYYTGDNINDALHFFNQLAIVVIKIRVYL